MSDPSTWDGLPDVKIDYGTTNALINGCENAATLIREQISRRRSLTDNALQDFEGRFSQLFKRNQDTANRDGDNIAEALMDVARQLRHLKDIIPGENDRRREAREWKARRDKDKSELTWGDLKGDENPPQGPDSPPSPKVVSANAEQRDTPQPGAGGGGGSGTSSARPGALRDFASGSAGKIQALNGKASKLRGLNADFTATFDWGTGEPAGVDGTGVYSALQLYNQLNRQDQVWVRAVAEAFDKAGSQVAGGMMSLSNSALHATLQAAGVSATRYDIPPTSPRMFGLKPTTGYADDPVNAATGNFVEPESDLGFAGGCSGLELTRMYNSFNREGGAFGPGWSSWTEVRLAFDDETALFTLPDGRVAVFPRLGDGWGKATGEPLWLERDESADELRVTDNDGGTWRFTASGTPRSHDRGDGTMVSFVHDADRLVRLEHERGRHITLSWDDDRVIAAETSDGRRITYRYGDAGQLTGATGPLGTRTYRWNSAGLIEAVIDADGVVEVENAYDEQGRVTSQRSPHGRTSRYTYLPGNVTEVADLDGTRANTWIHDARGRLLGIVDSAGNRQSTSYDSTGNPVLVTQRDGSATVREFDDRGHMIREVTPSGADIQVEYDDRDRVVTVVTEQGAVTTYSYEGASRHPSRMVDPEGGETRMEWTGGLLTRLVDPTGVETTLTYDEHGDPVTLANADGATRRLEYDDMGRVVAAVTPSGNRTSFVYAANGLAERHDPDGAVWAFEHTSAGRLKAVVDPTGARTEHEYGDHGDESRTIDPLGRAVQKRLDDLGNLASVELPDGSTWRFTHDGLSRLTETTTPDGQSWARSYNAVGDLVATVDPNGSEISVSIDRSSGTVVAQDPTGAVTHRFDALGRPVSAEQPDGSAAITTYDRCGRPVELLDSEGGLARIERDAAGRPVAITSPTGEYTRFEYDACGRRSATIDPLGNRTTFEYDRDGLPVRMVLPTGECGWIRYDVCGRVTSAYTPGAGTTRYTYDAAGRVVELKDGRHGLRRFRYDAAGQLVASTNGNGGVTSYEYDTNGRCVAVTDPLGHVTHREFDAMNRCVAETDPLGRTTRAGYDAAGRQAWQEDARGRRTEWTYDHAGRVASVSIDGRAISAITHDLRNRSVQVTDRTRADGREVIHTEKRNRRGQLVRRTRDGQTTSWTFDAAGRRTSTRLPNGQTVGYAYDAANRLVAVDHPLLGRATFEYDATGRLTASAAGGLIQAWEYAEGWVVAHTTTDSGGSTRTVVGRDDDGRIRSVDRDGATTFYDYDAACQLIEARLSDELLRWRYDTAGRLVSESRANSSREYSYDEASQLTAVNEDGGTTRHRYDEVGRRVRTEYADGRTRDLEWSPTGWLATIVEQAGEETTRTRLHVDISGQLASINDTPVFWDSSDAYAPSLIQIGTTPVVPVGPVTAIGDHWTTPGWRTSRAVSEDPWTTAAAAAAVPGLPAGMGIGDAGELVLGRLEWLGARVYDPASRGFLSMDPLDPIPGTGWAGNPYSYAGNDPLHALDPTGLQPVSDAELHDAATRSWGEQFVDGNVNWVQNNTDYIVGGLMVAAGVGATFIPGVGPVVGPALISAGADVIIQRAQAGKDGQINWKQVAISGAAGAVGGGSGAVIKSVGMTGARKVMTTVAVDTTVGAAQNVANYAVRPNTDWSWKTAGMEALKGSANGLIGGAQNAKFEPLSDAAGSAAMRQLGAVAPEVGDEAVTLTGKQVVAKHAAEFGVNVVKNAETEVLSQTLVDHDLDGRKFTENMLKNNGTGAIGGIKPGARTLEAPSE